MVKFCECGSILVHKRGTRNWLCDDKFCTVWSKKYSRNGNLIKTTRVAVPRNPQIIHDIIGEISK